MRDKNIQQAFKKELNLSTKIVQSKKVYSRKVAKQAMSKLIIKKD